MSWCKVNSGHIEKTTGDEARTMVPDKTQSGLNPYVYGCKTPLKNYGYAYSFYSGSLRQYWIEPKFMDVGKAILTGQKKEEVIQAKSDEAKALEAKKNRDKFLKQSKAGTTISCDTQSGAHMVSLNQIRLECDGIINANMTELMRNGWNLKSHTQVPDGDWGGYPRTRHYLMFVKN